MCNPRNHKNRSAGHSQSFCSCPSHQKHLGIRQVPPTAITTHQLLRALHMALGPPEILAPRTGSSTPAMIPPAHMNSILVHIDLRKPKPGSGRSCVVFSQHPAPRAGCEQSSSSSGRKLRTTHLILTLRVPQPQQCPSLGGKLRCRFAF